MSVTIFLGLWLGYISDLRDWLEQARPLHQGELSFSDFEKSTFARLDSWRSNVIAAPLITGGVAIAYMIARSLPNDLFDFPGYVAAFVFAVFIELSLVMVHLLGATGFWLLYVFTKASQELSKSESIDYSIVDEESMKPLADTVLKLCSFLLLIVASAMPGVALIVFAFKNVGIVLPLGIVFGVALPTIGLVLSFFGPIYYLHKILVKAKAKQVSDLKKEIRDCERVLRHRVYQASEPDSPKLDTETDRLLALSAFLRERLLEAQRRSVWPFNLSSILKLSGTSVLPVVTFFGEQVIRRVVS